MESFNTWISRKYVEWRGDKIGRAGTISAFAEWVGVSQPVMSYWMSGDKTPDTAKTINALVSRYGGEAYDILDLVPPSEIATEDQQALNEIAAILRDVPREKQGDLVFAVRAWAKQHGYRVE